MNENVATLLRIDHAQLTDFSPIVSRNMKQSSIADLPAHLGIEGRPIENDIKFVRFFARQNGFNHRLRLKKIVTKKFCRLDFQISFFDVISSFSGQRVRVPAANP